MIDIGLTSAYIHHLGLIYRLPFDEFKYLNLDISVAAIYRNLPTLYNQTDNTLSHEWQPGFEMNFGIQPFYKFPISLNMTTGFYRSRYEFADKTITENSYFIFGFGLSYPFNFRFK